MIAVSDYTIVLLGKSLHSAPFYEQVCECVTGDAEIRVFQALRSHVFFRGKKTVTVFVTYFIYSSFQGRLCCRLFNNLSVNLLRETDANVGQKKYLVKIKKESLWRRSQIVFCLTVNCQQ